MTPLTGLLEPAADRAVVTGGGSGIGRDVTLMLAEAGVAVHIVGRRAARLDETAGLTTGARVHTHVSDITDAEAVDAVFADIEAYAGPVPLLVNAASGAFLARAEHISPGGFRAVVDSGLVGPSHVLRRWARPLLEAGVEGAAVLVSSALASREVPGAAHSSAAKAGLEAMVRSTAVEWGPRGVRVNAIAPGAFHTEGADDGMWADERVAESALAHIPLGRFGTPCELRGPVALLLSRAGSYLTGTSIIVDGGWHLSSPQFGMAFPVRA